jgi:Xaa-Pro dipeptidase
MDSGTERGEALRKAQDHANGLFEAAEANSLIRPGISESQLNEEIYRLAERKYGITKYWHKRIVRAGANTLLPYHENPPDLTIVEDDILFLDLGPVFEDWEADFGRTFVIGSDPTKLKLRDDIVKAFAEGKKYFEQRPDITGAELYRHVQKLAVKYGWEYGGSIAGHLVGESRATGFSKSTS